MISRFAGAANRDKLVEAIQRQQVTCNDKVIAEKLADVAELIEFNPKSPHNVIIDQDSSDNDLYLILSGRVSVLVNTREVAVRQAGQHVGEMAMIDTAAPRCATVIAIAKTVVAKLSEQKFTKIADKHPIVWRQLALELGNRLRERGRFVKAPNPRPVIFIGSSAERRHIAYEIRDALNEERNMLAKAWTDDLFRPSATFVENLERELEASDFAVLIVTPDDLTISRKVKQSSPRDNIIWEHGFFTGGLRRERVFIVKPRGVDLKLPSDLLGVTPLEYDPSGSNDDLRARLGSASNGIRKAVARHGPR
jgi:predicted nucleotide-binding protein